jgi:hypothetical protein
MLEWDRYGLNKKCNGTRYTELVFLHPVGYVVYIEHSVGSGARNIDALFFMVGWVQYGFHKKRIRTCYTNLVFFIRRDLRVT